MASDLPLDKLYPVGYNLHQKRRSTHRKASAMPTIGPIKRKALIRYLKQLGFTGPYPGGNHMYMQKDRLRVRIPNPHAGDISTSRLRQILAQAGIREEEWERL